MTPNTRKLGRRQNSSIWSFLAVFVGYSTQLSAPETISTAHDPGYMKIFDVVKKSSIWSFLAVFVGYSTQFFWLRGRFQQIMTPSTCKLGRHQNLSSWSFLAVFMGYSTQFLALQTIPTTHDPGYIKIGTSSKFVYLVISGRFRGL